MDGIITPGGNLLSNTSWCLGDTFKGIHYSFIFGKYQPERVVKEIAGFYFSFGVHNLDLCKRSFHKIVEVPNLALSSFPIVLKHVITQDRRIIQCSDLSYDCDIS